jgi:hypothetical protein
MTRPGGFTHRSRGAQTGRARDFRGFMPVFRFRRLPARYGAVVMPLILSLLMSAIVSFIATWMNAGLVDDLVARWLAAWKVSWLIAFPTLLIVLPLVRRIVAILVEPNARH